MDHENKITAVIESAMKNLNSMVDVNTVVGKPIATETGTVLPICKVMLGFMTGGGEYGEVKLFKKDSSLPFAGGSGAVVSLKPAGFLLDDGKSCRYIHAGDDPLDNLIDKASDLLKGFADAGE